MQRSPGDVLYKYQFSQDYYDKECQRHSINLFLVLLIVVGLGLCCSVIPFVMMFSKQTGESVAATLEHTVDPCTDFYKYVCSSYRGQDVFKDIEKAIEIATLTDITSAEYPASNQLSWQKAAALYQACMSFTSAYGTETSELVNWMKSLNLDLLDRNTLATVSPADMMMRGALDLGVEAIISITFSDKQFWHGKRLLHMRYSSQQDIWKAENHGLNDYVLFLAEFGATSSVAYDLATRLRGYENHLEDIANEKRSAERIMDFAQLNARTLPYITRVEWNSFLYKYTNNTYKIRDQFRCSPSLGTMLVKLFESKFVGKEGLQYLIAWTLYRQLFKFTNPIWFLEGRRSSDACIKLVKDVMKQPITSHVFQSEPYPDVLPDRLFPTWIKYVSLNAHLAWRDQTTTRYDESAVNAYFSPGEHAVFIPTAIMRRPFLYMYGPMGLNYGALGT
ncbi:hypothetical protein MRX96_048513, partial [Rhipicephalus microplus]